MCDSTTYETCLTSDFCDVMPPKDYPKNPFTHCVLRSLYQALLMLDDSGSVIRAKFIGEFLAMGGSNEPLCLTEIWNQFLVANSELAHFRRHEGIKFDDDALI